MTAAAKLYAGAKAPEYQRIRIRAASGAAFDLTDVVGVTSKVRCPDGSTPTWTFVIESATATTLVITRVFASGGLDVAVASGNYLHELLLDFGGGVVRRVDPIRFTVYPYQ